MRGMTSSWMTSLRHRCPGSTRHSSPGVTSGIVVELMCLQACCSLIYSCWFDYGARSPCIQHTAAAFDLTSVIMACMRPEYLLLSYADASQVAEQLRAQCAARMHRSRAGDAQGRLHPLTHQGVVSWE
jgi:hypothetical protein